MTLVPPRRPCEGPEGRLCYVRCLECQEKDREKAMDKMMLLMEEYRELEDELQDLQIKIAELDARASDIVDRKAHIRQQWVRFLDGKEE